MASVRKEIESNVLTYHSRIEEDDKAPRTRTMTKDMLEAEWHRKISEIGMAELLRFAHPDDRSRLANKALEEGLLTREEAKEFIRFVR